MSDCSVLHKLPGPQVPNQFLIVINLRHVTDIKVEHLLARTPESSLILSFSLYYKSQKTVAGSLPSALDR